MSSYRILGQISRELRSLLWESFQEDAAIRQVVQDEERIVMLNPTETLNDDANRLSLWLYRVEENEFVKNQPPRRSNGDNGNVALSAPPLSLDLSYLLTPVTGNPESDLHLLGKTLQIFYENSIVVLHNRDEDTREELKIILARISLEELTRIWEALHQPYRLSVCYTVRLARVDPDRRQLRSIIRESNRIYGQANNESGGLTS